MTREQRLAQHISDLAAAFHVRLFVDRTGAPDSAGAGWVRGHRDRLVVKITPVIDETSYAVALHELGHCLAPSGMMRSEQGSAQLRATGTLHTGRDVLLQLEEEQAAWTWAQHYALEWTPLMASVKAMALATYFRTARPVLKFLKRHPGVKPEDVPVFPGRKR